MRIGIDLDGVVFDSETTIRTYLEIFAIENLEGSPIVDRTEPKSYKRYNWTQEEQQEFINKYMLQASSESGLMSGFLAVYKRLKELGCEFVAITARGGYFPEMRYDAERLLKENNIEFDAYHWRIHDKLEVCKQENVDIMIDDDHDMISQVTKGGIKALYFRDTGMKKLDDNPLVTEVNNWGDIYRVLLPMIRNSNIE